MAVSEKSARIEKELAVIAQTLRALFSDRPRNSTQEPLTCGRGSVAASDRLPYCLKITLAWIRSTPLVLRTILNPDGRIRPTSTSIFRGTNAMASELGLSAYGERQAAMVANQNGLGFRAAIRETAKVYGMPADEISVMSARSLSPASDTGLFPSADPGAMAQPALPDPCG